MKSITVIFLLFFTAQALCAEFGEYNYSKYIGIQQQLQRQRMISQRRQRMVNYNPTRNIRYPSANNPYPNIQRTPYRKQLTPYQRYSPRYYQNL